MVTWQARLAANDAKEKKEMTLFTSEGEKGALAAEAEAADIRRTEFASLAQSKMGKQAQLEELTGRIAKEQAGAAQVSWQGAGARVEVRAARQRCMMFALCAVL